MQENTDDPRTEMTADSNLESINVEIAESSLTRFEIFD